MLAIHVCIHIVSLWDVNLVVLNVCRCVSGGKSTQVNCSVAFTISCVAPIPLWLCYCQVRNPEWVANLNLNQPVALRWKPHAHPMKSKYHATYHCQWRVSNDLRIMYTQICCIGVSPPKRASCGCSWCLAWSDETGIQKPWAAQMATEDAGIPVRLARCGGGRWSDHSRWSDGECLAIANFEVMLGRRANKAMQDWVLRYHE